jgi:outer membrane receptor protein involved in Fe transport
MPALFPSFTSTLTSPLRRCPTALAAISLALLQLSAQAQTPATTPPDTSPDPAEAKDGLKLDLVVMTGTSTRSTKMKQSVSVSTLDSEQISKSGATSATELLRSVPGLRSESTGGEGNANVTVRGVPLSAGGSRYVQMQEDGLPLLMFGDIAFGTADQFLRVDYSTDRLEVIRGGSASTLASNSPGGIVNFISKTGAEKGGSIGLTAGLGNELFRLDADYGASLGNGTSFHIGGFQRIGEGGRPTGQNVENGGQIKANLTQKFDNGYVRLSLKLLDDKTPSLLPVPVTVSNGNIHTIPGIDPRTAFFLTPSLAKDTSFNKDGGYTTTSTRDGLHVKSQALGFEAGFDLGNDYSIDEKFRRSSNSGRFIALFPGDNGNNGSAKSFTGVLFNTSLDNFDNTFNDIKLSKVIKASGGVKTTLVGGLFYSVQNVAQTWFWNRYNLTLDGENAKVVDAAGNPTSAPAGLGWTTFGGCCTRTWDVQYTETSPYVASTVEFGALIVDGSLRRDQQKARGYTRNGDNTAQTWDSASQKTVNYDVNHTSYSLGANYAFNPNLAAFARASNGVAFSADRLLYGNPLDGSVPISTNEIDQVEAGVKWRAKGLSVFATLFNARTNESNYEVTTQKFSATKYEASGIELEAAYAIGDFRLSGGATFTDAEIKSSNNAAIVGKKPRRQADFIYQIAPSYAWGDLELGAALVGSGKSYGDDDNTIRMKGYTIVNAFVNYQLSPQALLSVSANNLFNTLAYTEIEGDGHAARAFNGRSVRATLKYSF